MQLDLKTNLSEDLENDILDVFFTMPLEHMLVIYAKLVHSGNFKPENHDLFRLNRRLSSKVYKSFLASVKEQLCFILNV